MLIIIYWLLDYRTEWDQFLTLLFFLLIMALVSWGLKRFNLFNRISGASPGRLRGLRYTFGIIVILAVVVISLYIAGKVAPPIDRFLDAAFATPTVSPP